MTPTQRSLERLRANGFIACKVEQRLPFAGGKRAGEGQPAVLRDAFGFGDILAAKNGAGVWLVQATSGSHVNARVKKATAPILEDGTINPAHACLVEWLAAGGHFQVWGWAKRGPRGKRKVWTLRIVNIYKIGSSVFAADPTPTKVTT